MTESGICAEIRERGFYCPVTLLSKNECKNFLNGIDNEPEPVDWWKSRAINSELFHRIANHETIVSIARSVIGPDVLLWGASVVTRKCRKTHPWHCDIETSSSPPGKTLSVWIGLKNVKKSSLKLISYSHKFSRIVQQAAYENSKLRGQVKDRDALEWARSENDRSRLIFTNIDCGEAVIFDGRLWHSSYNKNIIGTRKAILLQYASMDTEIRKFNTRRLNWPFDNSREPLAPCVTVSGSDKYYVNNLFEPQFRCIDNN